MIPSTPTNLLRNIPMVILWVCIIFFSWLLIHNAALYFTHGGEYGILPEKIEARKDWLWNVCFYIHLPAGIVCLVIPWVSFAQRIIKKARNIHRHAGNLYTWITLAVVCPTGAYLALYAKGGLVTVIGFLFQAVLLWWYTFSGWRSAGHSRNLHVAQMIRSYSVATVVLTFRILHLLFFFLNIPYMDNYAISQWLGLTINLLVAEIIIARRSIQRSTSNKLSYETN